LHILLYLSEFDAFHADEAVFELLQTAFFDVLGKVRYQSFSFASLP
jgi:hypothetical protein